MQTVTGHLTRAMNPGMSGLTQLEISTELPPTKASVTHALIESGFGMRQLVAALGGRLNSETALTYTIDDRGLVLAVEAGD